MCLKIKKEQMKKIKEAYLKAKANGTITIRTYNTLHEAVLDSLNTQHTIKFEKL
jgi:hypothetical protein